jgi:hypothetical protein
MGKRAIGLSTRVNLCYKRDQHPERSLAEHYNPLPLAMSLELVKTKAHEKLDREVDKVFGAPANLRLNGKGRNCCS